jgi:PAS domain S-box-containing protein
VLVPPRGLFASGKFDQYKRDIPYSTLVQAFQSLVRPLLGKSDAELATWRDAFVKALEPNGRLMTDLVPELKTIIGEQPPVPQLEPQQAQSRFQLVFRRFVGVFARPEHPLALFLDDLQWLDAATLELLEDLLTRPDLQHLMLIGAYRDNEVDATHLLSRKLEAIQNAGGKIKTIRLTPLTPEHLMGLIVDALRCESKSAKPLAELVHDKTAGNPFFVIQFLYALADEGLLHFDHDAACWVGDLDRINAKGYTDNVADLMVDKLNRLPPETQRALQQLACLGNIAEINALSIVLGKSNEHVRSDLWQAERLELVEHFQGTYKFIHDRVHEAAYSLIPDESRGEAHLLIGRLLVANTPVDQREETIFEIVGQLNRGIALIVRQEERDQLAELNLIAGKRAKAATAYASALTYLKTGAALLAEDSWTRKHVLSFTLEIERAECEFLTGASAEAEPHLAALSGRDANALERATVACLRVDLYTTLGQSNRAVAVGLDYLRHLGIEWPPHPTEEKARREYERILSQLAGRAIGALIELPLMIDPTALSTLDVLTKLSTAALQTDANLFSLVICRVVNLSIELGICDASSVACVRLGMVAGPRFGDYQTGFYFGSLGYKLVEQRGLKRFEARTCMSFGCFVLPWMRHVKDGRDLLRRALQTANRVGDLTCVAFSGDHLTTNLLAAGDRLDDVQREAENGLAFAQKAGFGSVIDRMSAQLGLIRTLRGLTPAFGSFDDGQFDELGVERRFSRYPDLAHGECWYWIRKLQARFFAGEYTKAVEASLRAQSRLWTLPSHFESAEFHLYSALSLASSYDSAATGERRRLLQTVTAHRSQLQSWAEYCPENFDNRVALVDAEIARIDGRDVDAMRLYEQAIRSARGNGFIQNEALASELAARFYAMRGFEKIARMYLQDARYGYSRWGADGKVRQLDELFPHLREEEPVPGSTGTIAAPVEHLDLATVLKVSQAISGEMVWEKLLDTLMRTAIEQAGAERGLLILSLAARQRISAEATTGGASVVMRLCDEPITAAALPESVLHYVLRTKESVILEDAATQPTFASDTYVLQRHARSILCLPLINQAKLIGVLYLENNLTPRAFAPARIAVLKLIASQAAISLENTLLYRDLEKREAKIQRLVDANIIGIYIFNRQGDIVEANHAFLKMVGYERSDLVASRVRWTDLTPAEWRDRTASAEAEIDVTGTIQPFEKEYFRKDGSRVPVLIGSAAFDEQRDEGVAFVVDLTERKRAEAEARESDRRFRDIEMELAHANRVTTIGQLTASIGHEVNQPITAARNNAAAALRFLSINPPDLEEVQEALRGVVRSTDRAGDIVGRIRALIKKKSREDVRFGINDAINDLIVLTQSEVAEQRVSVRLRLAEGLMAVRGDRVQLQQVVLNLILNALEAMSSVDDSRRELSISTDSVGADYILVAVSDSGMGVDPELLDRVFDSFYTTKPSGMGLGLSICRSIVDAHGGRLWADANKPRGAVFQFILPAADRTL